MTSEEKAKDLINKFYQKSTSYSSDRKNQLENAKENALIAVDEILNIIPCYEEYGSNGWVLIDNSEYWKEVKNEIENL